MKPAPVVTEYHPDFAHEQVKMKLRGLQAKAELESFFLQNPFSSSDSESDSDANEADIEKIQHDLRRD